jgi:uncharacterized membrane protein YqjE
MKINSERMKDLAKLKVLKGLMIALAIFSFVGLPVVINVWPAGWIWEPSQPDYEGMIGAIYAGLSVVLLWAVRDPIRHIAIVYAFIVSSIFHGGFMAYLAATQEDEIMHLAGDVFFNFAIAVLFFLFIPWGMLKEEDKTFLKSRQVT